MTWALMSALTALLGLRLLLRKTRPPGPSELSTIRGVGETSRDGKGLAGSCRHDFKTPTDLHPAVACRHTASLPTGRPLEPL